MPDDWGGLSSGWLGKLCEVFFFRMEKGRGVPLCWHLAKTPAIICLGRVRRLHRQACCSIFTWFWLRKVAEELFLSIVSPSWLISWFLLYFFSCFDILTVYFMPITQPHENTLVHWVWQKYTALLTFSNSHYSFGKFLLLHRYNSVKSQK